MNLIDFCFVLFTIFLHMALPLSLHVIIDIKFGFVFGSLFSFVFLFHDLMWAATKTILDGVNGEFRAGELTAVMGPSGAGKSTLLDILTGYSTNLASGTITINGRSRDLKKFRNQAVYIMQDDLLQMHITVWEAMFFSVNLKIGSQLKRSEKKERVSINRHSTTTTTTQKTN